MQYIDEIVELRERNFKKFAEALNSNDDFMILECDHIELVSNFAFPVICKSREILEKYQEKYEKAGVEIRPIVG
jgi:CDP-6-deoxy-D-xylo-4-hexulose-3-dehydrase